MESGNSGSNSNSGGGNYNTGGSGNSSSNGKNYEHWWSYYLNTGEKIEGSDAWKDPSTGNMYDKDGNQVGGIW